MIIAGTGHRPDKLGYGDEVNQKMIDIACDFFLFRPSVTYAISGMAQGWDQALAEACIQSNMPWTAAVPCQGQERMWPKAAQEKYRYLLLKATKVVMVSDEPYKPWLMQKRNVWMVDQANLVLALWNGSEGGTGNCLKYANKIKRPYENLWDKFKA